MSVLTVRSGDAYLGPRRLTVTVVDEDDEPYDLTDVDLTFGVFESKRSSVAEFTKVTPTEIEIASPQTGLTKGVAYVQVDPADTEDLTPGPFRRWELEATDAFGPVTLADGRFVVVHDLIEGA